MATPISQIQFLARQRLIEPTPRFWSTDEIDQIIIAGIKDLRRDIIDLKGEHFFRIDTNVVLPANSSTLQGVPKDLHKVYLIEPESTGSDSTNRGLVFDPRDYNDEYFRSARSRSAIDPTNDVIYYAITGAGAPVGAPVIRVAPQVTSEVALHFVYIPITEAITGDSYVPIPGDADNALVAWTVAYARAKEREDRAPDPNWIAIYSTEKEHLLQSLGLRQVQEPQFAKAVFQDYW